MDNKILEIKEEQVDIKKETIEEIDKMSDMMTFRRIIRKIKQIQKEV